MKSSRVMLAAVLCAGAVQGTEVVLNGRKFMVPDGFTVELAAGTNRVQRPVSACFDDQGRLYVTDSSGSNEAPDKQVLNPTHRVLRLTDSNGDGNFDQSVVYAEKVMFPQGCLWHAGSVYVAAPPSIWRFQDSNQDGVSDQREEWFKGGTLTGCANDIHGPQLGPDGYIYWTKGAFAEQTHTLANGRVLKDKAAHIFRALPDGSGLDVIMSGGMDNPVEIAFTPEGETLFSSTFIDFSQPGFRDGVAHAIYGGAFGKENDVMEDGRVKRTGPDLFHPFYQAGPAAECGLMRYEGEGLGAEFRDNLFATSFNLHKVTRHILQSKGATYASTDSDFLTSDDPDFHPTDVLQEADGSLLVVDTGGWYKLCCPSSQLAKPDVLGAIYRVKKVGRPTLAENSLRERQRNLAKPPSLEDSLTARLKQAAWKQDPAQAAWFREVLQQRAAKPDDADHGPVLRAAAEGSGRLRDAKAVPFLLQIAGATSDEFLTHSVIFALIEIAAPVETRRGLENPEPGTQRATLIALDQMDGSDLKPAEVVRFLGASDETLRRAASWILGRHSEWGSELAGWFREQLTAPTAAGSGGAAAGVHRAAALAQLHILTRDPAGQLLLADAIAQPSFPADTRIAALRVISEAGLKEPPASWVNAVRSALTLPGEGGIELMPVAVQAARTVSRDVSVQKALLVVAREPEMPSSLRLEALAALPAGVPLETADFAFARSQLTAQQAPAVRVNAAGLLARARLSSEQLNSLAADLKMAGPLELTKLLGAFDAGGDEALGGHVVSALRESKSARGLTPGQLKPHFAKFPEATQVDAEKFFEELNVDAAQQAAQLESLLKELQHLGGDLRRGQTLFNGAKAACSSCHRIGYLGGNVGPELTKIGEVRSERDLLEAMVFPSASFVRSYEPTTVVLTDGEEINGILRRETDSEIILVTGPAAEQRLPRGQVKELRPGTISVMPGGFEQALSRQEIADLLTFVKTVRWR